MWRTESNVDGEQAEKLIYMPINSSGRDRSRLFEVSAFACCVATGRRRTFFILPAVGWLGPASLERKEARECDQSQGSADHSAADVDGGREEELHRDIL